MADHYVEPDTATGEPVCHCGFDPAKDPEAQREMALSSPNAHDILRGIARSSIRRHIQQEQSRSIRERRRKDQRAAARENFENIRKLVQKSFFTEQEADELVSIVEARAVRPSDPLVPTTPRTVGSQDASGGPSSIIDAIVSDQPITVSREGIRFKTPYDEVHPGFIGEDKRSLAGEWLDGNAPVSAEPGQTPGDVPPDGENPAEAETDKDSGQDKARHTTHVVKNITDIPGDVVERLIYRYGGLGHFDVQYEDPATGDSWVFAASQSVPKKKRGKVQVEMATTPTEAFTIEKVFRAMDLDVEWISNQPGDYECGEDR